MKLIILSDNRQLQKILDNEHGLCVYLETEKYRCLLDTGASDLFIRNAEEMVIDLKEVDYVFISHGHSDHTGGLKAFLEINSKAKIVLSDKALYPNFYSIRNGLKNISCKDDFTSEIGRFVFVDSKTVFENEITVLPCLEADFPLPKANSTLMMGDENDLKADDFVHEIVVCFGTGNMLVYTGCAHHGVLNILDSVQKVFGTPAKTLVGGFHLLDGNYGQYESESEINELATCLANKYPETMFYTGHCTGNEIFGIMKKKLRSQLELFHAGFTFYVNK